MVATGRHTAHLIDFLFFLIKSSPDHNFSHSLSPSLSSLPFQPLTLRLTLPSGIAMTASSNMFDILELTTLIADDLSQYDLAACCLVNHTWYTTFTPHLWHSITIQLNDPTPKFQTPLGRAGLLRNGYFIRVLRTYSLHTLKPFVEHGVTCTNLVSLDAEYDPGHSSSETRCMKGRTPMMRARGRRGSVGTGQRQLQGPEEDPCHGGRGRREEEQVEEQDLNQAREEWEKNFEATRARKAEYRRRLGIVTQEGEGRGERGGSDGREGESAVSHFLSSMLTQRAHDIARARRDEEARSILKTILERNSRVEFVIVPQHCFESEAVVKVAAESLLCLREIHSASSMCNWGSLAHFVLSVGRQKPHRSKNVPSFALSSQQQQKKQWKEESEKKEQVLKIEGFLYRTNYITPRPLMKEYPRLKDLELEMVKSMNQWQMERIRTSNHSSERDLVCLEIIHGQPSEITQILRETPEGLTSITLTQYPLSFGNVSFDKIGGTTRSVFLKHAPTLEHFFARACAIENKVLQELLCFSPRLLSLEVIEEDLGMNIVFEEAELDAADAVRSPWVCEKLEVFECKISGVPRPDVTRNFFYFEQSHDPRPTIPPHPQGPAIIPGSPKEIVQRESRILQRKILAQLSRLTHLRVLTLGSERPDYDTYELYQLVVHGIGTMIVGKTAQYNCLELSLESGLDELGGLKELEELNVGQMGHRIGLAEVQWMVAHWPKLKSIVGLKCLNYNRHSYMPPMDGEVEVQGWIGQETGAGRVGRPGEDEPEHIAWIRKYRPDIHCPDF